MDLRSRESQEHMRIAAVVFCSDPLNSRRPDPAYQPEVDAVDNLGRPHHLIDYEALVNDGDPARAVRRVAAQPDATPALYRGWMLTPDQYTQLFAALAALGIHLLNDPAAYRHCHYLPEWYAALAANTPRSVWTKVEGDMSMPRIMELLRPFGDAAMIVKDFVKSRKHEWNEACYIPSASDAAAVERVVRRFVELQGDDLSEGLVFREFVEFEPLTVHSRSGMPLTNEWRLFFLDSRPVSALHYWDEGDYGDAMPPADQFGAAAALVRSRFFTMDVARRRDGEWLIVELGDGQVAGLPERADVPAFYRALFEDRPS